jgi:hypothetical protein
MLSSSRNLPGRGRPYGVEASARESIVFAIRFDLVDCVVGNNNVTHRESALA